MTSRSIVICLVRIVQSDQRKQLASGWNALLPRPCHTGLRALPYRRDVGHALRCAAVTLLCAAAAAVAVASCRESGHCDKRYEKRAENLARKLLKSCRGREGDGRIILTYAVDSVKFMEVP